jgi:hypothetical protein
MLGTTLDALLTAGFTFEESVHLIQSIIEGRSQASLPPVNGATSTEGSSATWANIPGPVPGPLVTGKQSIYIYNSP